MSETHWKSPAWAAAQADCRAQMDAWIAEAMAREEPLPWMGGTDEFTFMMPWIPHWFLTGDERMKAFMFAFRDRWIEYAKTHFHHGYFQSEAEEHHHTENYFRFLARLWYLDHLDDRHLRIPEHFAHHLGNWVQGVPEWYDWEKHRFRYRYLGTRTVNYPQGDYNDPGFFRYLLVAILTYLATGEQRYLDLCVDYADQWHRVLNTVPEGEPLPYRMDANWNVVSQETGQGNVKAHGIGYWLNTGFVGVMLDLFALTGAQRYADLARRILTACVAEAKAPVSNSMLLSHLGWHRLATGDASFDGVFQGHLEQALAAPLPVGARAVGVPPTLQFQWEYEGEKPAADYSPSFLCFAWQVTGDLRCAERALALAARRLELARSVGDDSRSHGCANGSTLGIVLLNVYPVLYTATMGMTGLSQRGEGHHNPIVLWHGPDGSLGLPRHVSALVETRSLGPRRVHVANLGDEMTTVRATAVDGHNKVKENGLPYPVARQGKRPVLYSLPPWGPLSHAMVRLSPGECRTLTLDAGDGGS